MMTMPETGQKMAEVKDGSPTVQSSEKVRKWPLYFAEQLYVGNEKSTVAICTLWSLKESVYGKLDPNSYSVIGNLYTFDGINYIIKNTLANPYVRSIILFGADMMKTGEALIGLVKEGVDEQNKIKGTNAYVEDIIVVDNVELFRSNVKVYDLRQSHDLGELSELVNKLNLENNKAPFAEPQYIIGEGKKVEGLDTEDVGFSVKGNTISEVWLRVISTIMKFGEVKDTQYKMKQRGVLNMQALIKGDEERIPEWLPVEAIKTYVDGFFIKEVPSGVNYTYPSRLFTYKTKGGTVDQVESVIKKLKDKPYTRQALAVIWNVEEDMESKEPPCLVYLLWNYKNGKLHQTVDFRSHDMYRAWPGNTYAMRELQRRIAKEAGMAIGTLTVISNDAHVYEDCWASAEKTVDTHCRGKSIVIEEDVRGSFLVTVDVESKEITVQHVRTDGRKSKYVWKGKDPEKLLKLIANEEMTQNVYHNMYIGKEVQRAKNALDSGKPYIQDAA